MLDRTGASCVGDHVSAAAWGAKRAMGPFRSEEAPIADPASADAVAIKMTGREGDWERRVIMVEPFLE